MLALPKLQCVRDANTEFRRDKRGNFSILAGASLLLVVFIMGVAVDMSRHTSADSDIQDALDTAALFATTMKRENSSQIAAEAKKLFLENLDGRVNLDVTSFEHTETEDGLELNVAGYIDPLFVQIMGYTKLNVSAKSGAVAQSDRGIELAIAFDTTASMGFGSSWQSATETLETVLTKIERYTGHEGFYVSLVPFSDRVRVGTAKASWLSDPAPSGWNGCFEPREENQNGFQWASDDDVPSVEPFEASIPGTTGGLSNSPYGGAPNCPSVPLTGPTSDVSVLVDAAQDLSTNGGTGRFDDALAWAWRAVSPNWAGLWGHADYPTADVEDRLKVVIMVTDGRTEAYTWEVGSHKSWGHNQGSTTGFEHMVHVCEQIKTQGIKIYMLRVVGNNHAAPYMQSCASDADHYKVINNNQQLELAFLDVLESIKTEMHLTY